MLVMKYSRASLAKIVMMNRSQVNHNEYSTSSIRYHSKVDKKI